MKNAPSLANSFDWIMAALAVAGALAVLQTFLVGQHYIIPTGILLAAILAGNLARYGLAGRHWARQILFWMGFAFTAHVFFALFFSVRYRELLGDAFELVCASIVIVFALLTWQYGQRNRIFRKIH